jgi:hypothetical protein
MRDGMISVGLDAPAQPGNGLYVVAGAGAVCWRELG